MAEDAFNPIKIDRQERDQADLQLAKNHGVNYSPEKAHQIKQARLKDRLEQAGVPIPPHLQNATYPKREFDSEAPETSRRPKSSTFAEAHATQTANEQLVQTHFNDLLPKAPVTQFPEPTPPTDESSGKGEDAA